MTRLALAVFVCTAGTWMARGQEAAKAPAFEVASVKPSAINPAMGAGFFTYPGGRIACTMCKLDYLLQIAFSLQPFQIEGGPVWIHNERFDLEAKPPASSKSSGSNPSSSKLPPNAEQRLMLQSLLADQFRLAFHRQPREGPVSVLSRSGKPLRLRAAADENAYPWAGSVAGGAIARDGLKGTNVSMQLLAERLSPYLERMVIDKTGLAGAYDFEFAYPAGDPAADVTADIFESLQAIGLKLEAGKGAVEALVIERAEKPGGN